MPYQTFWLLFHTVFLFCFLPVKRRLIVFDNPNISLCSGWNDYLLFYIMKILLFCCLFFHTSSHLVRDVILSHYLFYPFTLEWNSSLTNTTHSFDVWVVLESDHVDQVHKRKECLIDAFLIRLIRLLVLDLWQRLISGLSLVDVQPALCLALTSHRRPYRETMLACALATHWQRSDGNHNDLWLVLQQ